VKIWFVNQICHESFVKPKKMPKTKKSRKYRRPETYYADQALEKPLESHLERIRAFMRDGSAYHRSIYGDRYVIYPPIPGKQFSIEQDNDSGDGSCAYEIATSSNQMDAENYIHKLVFHIKGPGQYCFFVRRRKDRKIVYEYFGSTDFNLHEHDSSFVMKKSDDDEYFDDPKKDDTEEEKEESEEESEKDEEYENAPLCYTDSLGSNKITDFFSKR